MTFDGGGTVLGGVINAGKRIVLTRVSDWSSHEYSLFLLLIFLLEILPCYQLIFLLTYVYSLPAGLQ